MNPLEKQLWMRPARLDGAPENVLREIAEKEGAISVRKLHQLMQVAADSAAREVKERHFTHKNVCSGAVDYVIPDPTGLVCVVSRPVPLSERQPADSEKNEHGQCYYGSWYHNSWHWYVCTAPFSWSTHFLPAGVEVLPAACFAPEEENEVEEPKEKVPDTELLLAEWDVADTKFEHCVDPLERKWAYSVRAEIQRKDRKPFDSVIGKFIKVLKNDMLFEIRHEKKRHFLNSDGSVSVAADILCVSRECKP